MMYTPWCEATSIIIVTIQFSKLKQYHNVEDASMSIGCALLLHWEVYGVGQSTKFIIVMLLVHFA